MVATTETPFEVSSQLVDEWAELLPQDATFLGISGHDHRWDDLSPSGRSAVADLARRYRARLDLQHPAREQRLAAEVLTGWLDQRIDQIGQLDHLRDLAHMISPFDALREIFDVMDTGSAEGWEAIAARLETIEQPYAGYRESLDEGRRRGVVAADRQVRSVIGQARLLAGDASSYLRLPEEAAAKGFPEMATRVAGAVVHAQEQAAGFADYLTTDYLPSATDVDGVGSERYLRAAERFLGMPIDPREVYNWGWDEIARITGEMKAVGATIQADAGIDEVVALLETDPERQAPTVEWFISFIEKRLGQALSQLNGLHFDIPPVGERVTVNLAPAGSPPGAYYLSPSEDFTRAGGVWYAVPPGQPQPLYQEVATAYHEGFPGHHLQIVTAMAQSDSLSRAHRVLISYSGYSEGWALYTERLMEELGYYELPEYRFGLLASQIFRAARVVVDIGLHLDFPIPAAAPLAGGERWSFETAVSFMQRVGLQSPAYAESEVKRYLGWPAQAISYKVGEREILALRDLAAARPEFSLRDFHRAVLGSGDLPLGLLRQVVLEG